MTGPHDPNEALSEGFVGVDVIILTTESTLVFASGVFRVDLGHPLLSHFDRLAPIQAARDAQSSASCSSDLIPVNPIVISPPLKSVPSQTPNLY